MDFKYEISESLSSLYDYFIRQVMEANIKKDAALLDEVMPIIKDLRDTYSEADKRSRSGAAKA